MDAARRAAAAAAPRDRARRGASDAGSGGDALDAALVAARERGAGRVAAVLAGPEMLSSDAFAALIGATRETVNRKLRRHEALGLEGATRRVRYPDWQVTDDGKLLPGLPELFERLGGAWAVYRFLLQRHPELGGATALEGLKAGRTAEVIEAADGLGLAGA